MSEEDAQEEHRDIGATAAAVLDSLLYHDPEDPPKDES